MTEADERILQLCETLAIVADNMSRAHLEVLEILQSALGLREGLRAPDEMSEPTHFLDGAPIRKG